MGGVGGALLGVGIVGGIGRGEIDLVKYIFLTIHRLMQISIL